MESKQVIYNMFCSIVAFVINYFINFLLTPYISANLPGTYGYVKLANDFVLYIELITISLNSMAGRFISIEYNKGNIKKAQSYFSSVLFSNIGFVLILFIPCLFIVTKLDSFFEINVRIVNDIKLLFLFSFSSFFVGIISSVYSLAAFVKNRLDCTYMVNMVISVLRALLLVLFFCVFGNRVYYVGLVAFIVGGVRAGMQYYIHKRILPEIEVAHRHFDIKLVVVLLMAGIWNTVQKFGQILLDGLDVLIANTFIGNVAMGNVSFAKTMPGIIASLLNTMAHVFTPQYTMLYARNELEELKKSIKKSMLFLSIVISVPVGIIMAVGQEFYSLWIPNEDVSVIFRLSVISCVVYVISTPMNAIYNLFTVKNKVKYLSLVTLGSGIVSTICVLVLLKYTDLGVVTIVGCSTIIGIIRNVFFVAPYAAKMMEYPIFTFFPEIGKSVLSVGFVFLIAIGTKRLICIEDWMSFLLVCLIVCVMSFGVNYFILLNQSEKEDVKIKIKEKIIKCKTK